MSRTALLRRALAATAAVTAGLVLGACGLIASADETYEPPIADDVEVTSEAPVNDAAGSDQAVALAAYALALEATEADTLAAYADVYSDYQVNAVGDNAIEYAYTYLDQVDAAVAAAGFDDYIPEFDDAVQTGVIPEMEAWGITENPQVIYTYYNADGSIIWTYTFSKVEGD